MWVNYTGEGGHFKENALIKIQRQKAQLGSDSSELRSSDTGCIYLFTLMFSAADTSLCSLSYYQKTFC